MPRNVSTAFVEAVNATQTDEAFLILLSLSHPDLGADDPIRLTSDSVPTWSADQDSTTAEDNTANGNDGTLVNGPTWTSDGPNDAIRGALSFDGTDDYVDFGDSNEHDPESADFTAEFWFNTVGPTGYPLSKAIQATDDNGWTFQHTSFDNDSVGVGDGANTASVFIGDQTDNQWHHLAIVVDRTAETLEAFLDGTSKGTADTSAVGSINPSVPLRAGVRGSSMSGYYEGTLSDIRIWKGVARTQQQIQDNMNKRLNGDESGLVGYWPLDDTTDKYEPFPFKVSLPEESDDTSGALAHLKTDAVDRRIIDAVRRISGVPNIDMEVVLSSDPDSIELTWPTFRLSNARYTKQTVEGDLVLELLEQEPFPGGSINPGTFPGAF